MGQYLLYNGGADEHASIRLVSALVCCVAEEREVEVGLEAFLLAAEMVSVHSDIKASDEFLPTLLCSVGAFREQDEAGACAPGGFPLYSAL